MITEKQGDLFAEKNECWLAHCVSADFGMGAGIAVLFNKHFDMKNRLKREFPFKWKGQGYCLVSEGVKVYNLVTKRYCWDKPTYDTLKSALVDMKEQAKVNGVTKIAMPLIGCGLDRLEWEKVRLILDELFENSGIDITVCKL